MTRSILTGLLALVCVGALGVVPVACQSGGVGDPCTPEDEYNTQFAGFKVQEENIESRSFQCSSRICLVNHFQGRVSCPYGQAPTQIKACGGKNDTTTCAAGESCVETKTIAPDCDCDSNAAAGSAKDCKKVCGSDLVCDPTLKICTCTSNSTDQAGNTLYCDYVENCTGTSCPKVLKSYMCHKKGDCQSSEASDTKNEGKQCCVPGTDKPVNVSVCSQCKDDQDATRSADKAVYCSCRCCPKCCSEVPKVDGKYTEVCEEDPKLCGTGCDPNFNYCSCPNGYTCSKIRENVGLGDPNLTGSYCIREKTEYTGPAQCSRVIGYTDNGGECFGTKTGVSAGDGG